MPLRDATAAILIGGASRRMGRDKADLIWNGRSLLEHVQAVVSPLVREVLVVVRSERQAWAEGIAPAGCRVVTDQVGARGPLAGIQAALMAAAHERVLVTACDMPQLQPALLAGLLDDDQGDVVIPRSEKGFEPLLAVYRKSCLPAIEEVLARGSAPVPSFFDQVKVSVWGQKKWERLDPEGLSLINFNRPEDLGGAS